MSRYPIVCCSWRCMALLLVAAIMAVSTVVASTTTTTTTNPSSVTRASKLRNKKQQPAKRQKDLDDTVDSSYQSDAIILLAQAIRPMMEQQQQSSSSSVDSSPPPSYSTTQLLQAFESLGRAQQTLKTLDGISHEAYQRTRASSTMNELSSVRGRARRSAARASAAANGLLACELCEYMEVMVVAGRRDDRRLVDDDDDDVLSDRPSLEEFAAAVLKGRTVLHNSTQEITLDIGDGTGSPTTLNLLILYEPDYRGGAGIHHGGIHDAAPQHQVTGGRLLVLLSDSAANSLPQTLQCLYENPMAVSLPMYLPEQQVAYVHPQLYQAAGQVLERLKPHLRNATPRMLASNATTDIAIHFVGRSLAGGVASTAAAILDGGLPMPARTTTESIGDNDMDDSPISLCGYRRRRTSAVTLGAPPCISSNVDTECITSILNGDDIVCRTTKAGMDRFLKRVRKACHRGSGGGLVGRQLSRMTETLAMAATSVKKQRQASTQSKTLCVPGRAFLVRPRRLENHCSMHEVGQYAKQKREALRAAVLWQLNDVLLSKSLWKHHQLESYIYGLDRVQLRGVGEELEEQPTAGAVAEQMNASDEYVQDVDTEKEDDNEDEVEEEAESD